MQPLRTINADPRVMEFYPAVLTPDESDAIVESAERHFEANGFGLFSLELKESQICIGFVGLQNVPFSAHFTPAVEIGWRVAFEHWNRGYATEAAAEVLKFAFSELKLSEVVAMTYRGNLRSRRVMEKLKMSCDPRDDFDHPHPKLTLSKLKPHVLYRINL